MRTDGRVKCIENVVYYVCVVVFSVSSLLAWKRQLRKLNSVTVLQSPQMSRQLRRRQACQAPQHVQQIHQHHQPPQQSLQLAVLMKRM